MPWYQGSFHCHSTNSDGSASPLEVARYYKAIGMNFVAIADHNFLTEAEEYQSALAQDFIAIPCCEYTASGSKDCHVVGVDVNTVVGPEENQDNWSTENILQEGIDQIRTAGGVPIVCHPCWNWAFDHQAILRLKNVAHFEVFNAHPDCNSYPIAGASYVEQIWDQILSSGVKLFGSASDDAHWYGTVSEKKTHPHHIPFGGTGWNVIKADKFDRQSIRQAFEAGHFYATTGIHLAEYRVTDKQILLNIKPWSHEKVAVEFIGQNGQLLDRQIGLEASYAIRGDEKYIRIRLADTTGCFAFTQPVFLDSLNQDSAWTLED